MSSALIERAVQLFAPQADFLLPRLGPHDVVLIVESARERRFAIVTPEEAAVHVETLAEPGVVLGELRTSASAHNGVQEGFFWIVVVLGEARTYVTLRAEKAELEPFEVRRERALLALGKHVERSGVPRLVLEGGFVVMTLQGSTERYEVRERADALAVAQRWSLPVSELAKSPGSEPGAQRAWVLAWVDGGPIYFWFSFVKINPGVTN